ncbi:MAG: HAMP domain-containing protein [Betaproteobacteria bacterium]|nr:HAMP domain-containing protein [Betaproteobacteria bacterium]
MSSADRLHEPKSWRLGTGLLALLAICLVPAVAGAALYLSHLRDTALRDAYRAADLVAIGTSDRLRWLLQDAEAMLASMAARPLVRSADPTACDPLLAEFRTISPAFKTLALRLTDGRSLCSELPQPPSQQSVAAAPWFQAAVRQPGFHVSDGHLGNVQNEWTVRLTYPVKDASGQTVALLITPLDLRQLQERLFAQLPASNLGAVVDAANRVLVRSTLQGERAGKPAVENVSRGIDALRREARAAGVSAPASLQFPGVGIDGVRRLFVIRTVPMSGWVAVSGVPEDETLRDYRATRNRSQALILVVLLAAGLAAWRVSRGIRLPILGLAAAARSVARGDLAPRAPDAGPTEIRDVAREFNSMVVATAEARERLRTSEREYRTLLQNLPVAVVSHASDGAVELFNDRACALLRMTPEQMRGTAADSPVWHFVDAQGERVQPCDYPVAQLLRTHQPLSPQIFGIVAGDAAAAHTWVLVNGYPQLAGDGRLLHAVVAFVDISAQHEAEQLRLAKESAEAASQAKSDFLSRLSHELRTPLNAIIGFSQLIQMDPQLPAERRAQLGHVLSAGEHLLSLINQILDISSIESGAQKVATQAVPLAPLLETCVAICRPLAQAGAVALEVARPLPGEPDPAAVQVQVDPTRLRQVVMNLLSNAVKYNRPQGSVRLAVRQDGAGGEGPGVHVDITDSGIGLAPAQLERLFEPFNRVGAERTGVEGHGLGLAHSRALARSMGGEITVSSQPGQGSCFTLHLQRAGHPAAASRPGRVN